MQMIRRKRLRSVTFLVLITYLPANQASAEGIITRLFGDPHERFEQAVADLEHRPGNPAYWFEFY